MTKMIKHRVFNKQLDEHPAIQKLNAVSGMSVLDGPNSFVDVECEIFYVIPLSFTEHPAIKLLSSLQIFDMHDDQNTIYLPIKPAQAYMLGKSCYTADPIDSYVNPIKGFLDPLATSDVIVRCEAGDKEVIGRVLENVRKIQSYIKGGLETQKVHAAYPYTDEDHKRDQAAWNKLTKQ